jgi:ABC-type transport system involved in multi-copper enzyme maturation permease subunit
MPSNPIVRFELIRAARQPRHYAMRAAAGLMLAYVAWMLYRAFDEPWLATAGAWERSRMLLHLPWIADLLVLELVWTQGLAIILLVPGLAAGSIAEEDRRGTMRDLLGTPLSGGSIVLGKLAVRLVQVGAAMAIGLPVVVPLALLGALDLAVVARAYAMLIALAAFIGSLAMLVAVVVRRPWSAILWAYLVVAGWLLLPAWSAALAGRSGWPFPWLLAVVEAIRQSHPLEAARNLWLVAFFGLRDPTTLGWAWAGLSRALPRAVGLQMACSAIFLLLASLLLRPRRLEAWGHRGRETIARSRPAVDEDDPMLWKETQAHARLSWRVARVAVILLVAFVAWPLLGLAADAFREWRASWWDALAADWRRYDLNEALRNLGAGLCLLGLVAATAMAATSVTGERERGTWTSLAMTLVDGGEVVRAKVAGALWAVRGLLVPFAVIWGIGLATGSVHPIGVLASAAGLVALLGYGAALGVLSSMTSPNSGRAIVVAFAALLAGNALALSFVPLDLVGQVAGSWSGLYLAGVSPFIEWLALASPMDVHWSLSHRTWDVDLAMSLGLWGTRVLLVPGLIRVYLVGLALHALAAGAAMRAAAWAFHARHPLGR